MHLQIATVGASVPATPGNRAPKEGDHMTKSSEAPEGANASTPAPSGLSPRQLELRRRGVGASEIAVLAGLSRWSSPIAIWESKVRGRGFDPTYPAELGLELEDPIARVWARRNGRTLARVDTLQHPAQVYALATPDRAVFQLEQADAVAKRLQLVDGLPMLDGCEGAERLLQVKSTNWRMRRFWGEPDTDQIPAEYLCQAHWEGAVAGVERVTFAVDFDKTQLFTYEVPVRLSAFDALYEIAERFMREHVLPQVPPSPDDSARYADFLVREFPKATNRAADPRPLVVEHEPEVYAAIELFAKLEAAADRMKKLRQAARNRIQLAIGTGTGLSGTWGKITWLQNKDSTITDWKGYANALATIAALLVENMPKGEERDSIAKTLRELHGKHQKIRKGGRTLRKTFKGALAFDLDVLELRLDKLAAGLAEAVNEEVDSEAQYDTKEGDNDE
jgi:predicted phage-related endonuclease